MRFRAAVALCEPIRPRPMAGSCVSVTEGEANDTSAFASRVAMDNGFFALSFKSLSNRIRRAEQRIPTVWRT
jgi:hypothetical protein